MSRVSREGVTSAGTTSASKELTRPGASSVFGPREGVRVLAEASTNVKENFDWHAAASVRCLWRSSIARASSAPCGGLFVDPTGPSREDLAVPLGGGLPVVGLGAVKMVVVARSVMSRWVWLSLFGRGEGVARGCSAETRREKNEVRPFGFLPFLLQNEVRPFDDCCVWSVHHPFCMQSHQHRNGIISFHHAGPKKEERHRRHRRCFGGWR